MLIGFSLSPSRTGLMADSIERENDPRSSCKRYSALTPSPTSSPGCGGNSKQLLMFRILAAGSSSQREKPCTQNAVSCASRPDGNEGLSSLRPFDGSSTFKCVTRSWLPGVAKTPLADSAVERSCSRFHPYDLPV